MGWTSFHLNEPIKKWFKHTWEDGDKYEVLDSALVYRQHLYGAIKDKKTGEVFCAVFIISWSRNYYNFSYKDMTEFAGPVVDDCPPKIFKLLTPLNEEDESNRHAKNWRERVKRRHNALAKINKGYILYSKNPIKFTDGIEHSYFQKKKRVWYRIFWDGENIRHRFPVRFNPFHYDFELLEEKEYIKKFAQ